MRTLLRLHLGLGDFLLCNGLVRTLIERGHKLLLPCYPHNEASVGAMFADLGDAVEIALTATHENLFPEWKGDSINLGDYGQGFGRERFDESFYQQAGVPFLAKWERFKIPGEEPLVWRERVVIHDDPERGFSIPLSGYRFPSINHANKQDPPVPISEHRRLLSEAKEIHCINSCFAILADLINAPGKKYLHRYARPDGGALPIFGREWTILDQSL
jgi:hypothetical protein